MGVTLAIDIGGTKFASALVDEHGELRERRVTPTPVTDSPALLFDALRSILPTRPPPDMVGIGIASAGPIDTVGGTVSPVNIPAWRDFPLVAAVERTVPGMPVMLLGDAIAATVGEITLGSGRGVRTGVLAVVSTGIGGGVFLGGRVITGATGNAGHLGHTVVAFEGVACACGGRGCVEAYASGPSMVRHAEAAGWRGPPGATTVDLAASARAGDTVARSAVETGARALAAMIASQAAALEIDIAILGGGVMRSADLVMPAVDRALADYAHLPFIARVAVRTAALGPEAGLVGAGLVAHDPSRLRASPN